MHYAFVSNLSILTFSWTGIPWGKLMNWVIVGDGEGYLKWGIKLWGGWNQKCESDMALQICGLKFLSIKHIPFAKLSINYIWEYKSSTKSHFSFQMSFYLQKFQNNPYRRFQKLKNKADVNYQHWLLLTIWKAWSAKTNHMLAAFSLWLNWSWLQAIKTTRNGLNTDKMLHLPPSFISFPMITINHPTKYDLPC